MLTTIQLAQDDDGFEIRSFGSALDEEEAFAEPEAHAAPEQRRDLSPVPPKPVPSAPRQRESLDGETIFAVGEDGDKWSDDEAEEDEDEEDDDDDDDDESSSDDDDESHRESGERKRLTSKRQD